MLKESQIIVDEQLDNAMLAVCDAVLRFKGMQMHSTINDLMKSISEEKEESVLADA